MLNRIKLTGISLLTLVMAMVIASAGQAGPMWKEKTNSKAAQSSASGGECVKDTAWMRRYHMDLLQHDRDTTVHQGIRTNDGSLSECIACHVNTEDSGKQVPVNAYEGPDGAQFCAGCHAYTGVKLDCFQCHSPVPAE